MLRRPSITESTTSSSGGDVTFDDVDDSHVFAYLDEGEAPGSPKPAPASRAVEFRLDFSSRVNPAPAPAPTVIGSPTMSRRSSTSSMAANVKLASGNRSSDGATNSRTLQRSPSMRSPALPFRKRLSRRPSEPFPDASIVSTATAAVKLTAVRPESPPSSPPPSPPAPLPMTVGPNLTVPVTKPSPSESHASVSTDTPTTVATQSGLTIVAAAIHAASAAAATALEESQAENGSLRDELSQLRATITELQDKLQAAEKQNEALANQLLAVQDAYEDKLRVAYDDTASERGEALSRQDAALAALREQFGQEREELQNEMRAAVNQVQSELLIENERLQRLVLQETEQKRHLVAQYEALEIELKQSLAESQQRTQFDASRQSKNDALQATADHWEAQCQVLQDQVHQLLHEQDKLRRREATEKETNGKKLELQRVIQQRFAMQLQLLQSQLKTLAIETREMMKKEMKKTTLLVTRLQEQASELAIQQNDKSMALVARQNRIIQLETQLKNERQSVSQLDASLAKTMRVLQKKEVLFKSKYHEQKEFLDITVAVRNGLTHELQNKRKKLEELELHAQELQRSKAHVERKNKHLVQQVKIMQHVYAREMEQVVLGRQQDQQETRQPCQQQRGGERRTSTLLNARLQSRSSGSHATGSNTTAATTQLVRLARRGSSGSTAVSSVAITGGCVEEHSHLHDEDSSRRQHRSAEDDVFAAQEWSDFVELTALHEAECQRHFRQQM